MESPEILENIEKTEEAAVDAAGIAETAAETAIETSVPSDTLPPAEAAAAVAGATAAPEAEEPAPSGMSADEAFEKGDYREAFRLYSVEETPASLHVVRQALSALYEADPAEPDTLALREAVESARFALDERIGSGDVAAEAEKKQIDTDIAALLMSRIDSETVLPEAYPSLASALNARADRLGTAELLADALPLLLSEEAEAPVLEAALSFTATLRTAPLLYKENGFVRKLAAEPFYTRASEKKRLVFVKMYNALPERKKTRETLENAVKTAKETRKNTSKRLNLAKAARKPLLRDFYASSPSVAGRRKEISLRSWIFAIPGAALFVAAAIYTRFGGHWWMVIASASLLVLGVILALVFRKKKIKKLEKNNATGALAEADSEVFAADRAFKEAGRNLKNAKKNLKSYIATDMK